MNKKLISIVLCLTICLNCMGGDSEHSSRNSFSSLFHSTVDWWYNASIQKQNDEQELWNTSVEKTIDVLSKVKTQTTGFSQKFHQFGPLAQYYAGHYGQYCARSPYATGAFIITAGALIGSPELSALGVVGGCTQVATGSLNDLGTKQQQEFGNRVEAFNLILAHQQNELRKTLDAFGGTVATLDDRVINLNKTLTNQQDRLTQTFNDGAKILVTAGSEAGQIFDARIKTLDETLTNQQEELRRTFKTGTESIKEVTREAIHETISHTGRTAVQSFAYVSSIGLGANFVYRNLSREIITNKELSLAALGGLMIAAPVYLSTRTMRSNPLDSRVVN